DGVVQERVGAHRALARFDELGLVADRAAIADEAAIVSEDRLAADANMELSSRQLRGEAELAERLMRVEHGFVLAPERVGLGIAAGLLPARLADKADLRLACTGDQGEAMRCIGLPDPVAAD